MVLPGPFNEGVASISNSVGNLLFYTDGVTVWNRTHKPMLNGSNLPGHFSTSQALIVKQPGNSNIYFVFSLVVAGNSDGLSYSVVDMNLSAGNGSVTAKGIKVYGPATEKIAGVRHCNGMDIWVLTHEFKTKTFRAHLVTPAGVSKYSIPSSVGTKIDDATSAVGCLKFSSTGRKIAMTVCASNMSSTCELFDFDPSTGSVSNPVILDIPGQKYGCEFSPDGTKLYATDYLKNSIYQWDLCAGSSEDIEASLYTIQATNTAQMQLAPDGKIYVARGISGETMLGVINNPDLKGNACNYVNLGQSVAPNASSLGLPNFVVERSDKIKPPAFLYTVDTNNNCHTVSFSCLPAACVSVADDIKSVAWNFGDVVSGEANVSFLPTPAHIYPRPGRYNVSLIYYYLCGADTLSQEINIPEGTCADRSPDFSPCTGAGYSVPNAFTPNGDGINDMFCLQGWNCTTDFNMSVFNRWGEKMFESSDHAFCWPGTYNGKVLEPDVYVFIIWAKRNDQSWIDLKGNLMLIR